MKKEESVKYIATLSGGKDSTAMCDLLLKNGYPVDYILFYDTKREHKEMITYIKRVNEYFNNRYKKEITFLTFDKYEEYDDYVFSEITRGENKGKIFGFGGNNGFCHWRTYSKIEVEKKFTKQFKNKKLNIYIGFTKHEKRNLVEEENKNFIYPLKEYFGKDEQNNIVLFDKKNKEHSKGLTEEDCKEYLINQEMENPLYRHFSRTGCADCEMQSKKAWFNIWKYYPDIWEKRKQQEVNLSKIKNVINPLAFGKHSIFDWEKEFKKADSQGSLFDFSDEPLKNCFCKI